MAVPNKTPSGTTRLQYDTEGELVAKLVKSGFGPWIIWLEPGYQFVRVEETGRVRIWGGKDRKLIEFAKTT
jgi:hypothetical protein